MNLLVHKWQERLTWFDCKLNIKGQDSVSSCMNKWYRISWCLQFKSQNTMLKEITTTKIDPNFIIRHESNEALISYYEVCAKSHSNKSFGRLINFKKLILIITFLLLSLKKLSDIVCDLFCTVYSQAATWTCTERKVHFTLKFLES